jgi:F-type H+-transporting ATPase subunit epsilon
MSAATSMNLKILLPFKVLMDAPDIRRIVAETSSGSVGFWPHRLDCAAVLVPGILTFEAGAGGEQFIALDRGVLVKTGMDVRVSVRNAVAGGDLGSLRRLVDAQFESIDETERQSRALLSKMESEIIRETTKFQHG